MLQTNLHAHQVFSPFLQYVIETVFRKIPFVLLSYDNAFPYLVRVTRWNESYR